MQNTVQIHLLLNYTGLHWDMFLNDMGKMLGTPISVTQYIYPEMNLQKYMNAYFKQINYWGV